MGLKCFAGIECHWPIISILFCDADGGNREDLQTAVSSFPQSQKADGVVPLPLFLQEEQQVFQAGQMPCPCTSYSVCARVTDSVGIKGSNRCTQWLHGDSATERLLHYYLTKKTVRSISCAAGVFLARENYHLLMNAGDVTSLRCVASLCPGLGPYQRRLARPQGSFAAPAEVLGATAPATSSCRPQEEKLDFAKGLKATLSFAGDEGSVGRPHHWVCVSWCTAGCHPREEMQHEVSEARGSAVPNGTHLPKSPAPGWLAQEPSRVGLAKRRHLLQGSGK